MSTLAFTHHVDRPSMMPSLSPSNQPNSFGKAQARFHALWAGHGVKMSPLLLGFKIYF